MGQRSNPGYAEQILSPIINFASFKQFLRSFVAVCDVTAQLDSDRKPPLPFLQITTLIDELIDFVHPDLCSASNLTTERALITMRNREVEVLNDEIYSKLGGPDHILFLQDESDAPEESAGKYFSWPLNRQTIVNPFFRLFQTRSQRGVYNSLNVPNVPPHKLHVKGMECFVFRKLSPDDSLLNNTKSELYLQPRTW